MVGNIFSANAEQPGKFRQYGSIRVRVRDGPVKSRFVVKVSGVQPSIRKKQNGGKEVKAGDRPPGRHAGVAQLAEQRICNPRVWGSNPHTGSTEGWQSG